MRRVHGVGARRGLKLVALGVAATAGLLLSAPMRPSEAAEPARAAAAPQPWPTQVHAVYDIEFSAINVGTFEFNSNAEGGQYNLVGNAKLSAMLGALHWSGQTNSTGRIVGDAPKPSAFNFDFKSNSKSGSTKIGFANEGVTSVANEPPVRDKPGVVPVREPHLKGVLDPLTAVMALSRTAGANPCGRRLAIFDGKQRFDLLLTYRGQVRIAERRPSGQPNIAYVCRVRYIPIAGHKADEETGFMARNDQIEITLRPIPSAGVFVPHEISVPTVAGRARLISKRIEITGPGGRQQIALVH